MRKIAFAIVLLAACGRRNPGLTIAITADGFVKVDGKALTLDELGNLLAARRGAAPLEEVESVKVSSLPVLLDIEDDAVLRHVQWVMCVLAEQMFWRLSLPGGRDAPLPVNSGLCVEPADRVALLVRVLVLEDGEYALGDRTTRDVEEVGRWIDASLHAGITRRIGQIGTQPRVTWRLIRPAFDLLRGRGVKRIEFPLAIPAMSVRARSPLPPPETWMLPAGWSGLRVVDYWSEVDSYEGRYGEDLEEAAGPEEDLIARLDSHRGGLALPDFAPDETLRTAAAAHAGEMARMGYFGHFSPVPGNRSPSDRLAKLGWPEERRHAELLAKAENAAGAFKAIVAKPENEKALGDPAFRYAGIAQSGDCWVVLLGADE